MIWKRCWFAVWLSLAAAAPTWAVEVKPAAADREILKSIYAQRAFQYETAPNLAQYMKIKLRALWHRLMDLLNIPVGASIALDIIQYVLLAAIILLMAWILVLFLKPRFRSRSVAATGPATRAPGLPSPLEGYRAAFARGAYREALALYVRHFIVMSAQSHPRVHPAMTLRECARAARFPSPPDRRLDEIERCLYAKESVGDADVLRLVDWLGGVIA